jgi:hypothetical protein
LVGTPNSMRILYNNSLLTGSQAFLKSATPIPPLQCLTNEENLTSSWSDMLEPILSHHSSFIYIYGLNLERRILYKILYEVDSSDIPWCLLQQVVSMYYSKFYHSSCNWYNNRLLQLIRQFFLIWNRINEFMELR